MPNDTPRRQQLMRETAAIRDALDRGEATIVEVPWQQLAPQPGTAAQQEIPPLHVLSPTELT